MMHLKKIKVSTSSGADTPMTAGKHYYVPSFSVDAEQMPEIKSWKVGGKYRIMIEVEQKSKNEREESVDASFDILAYKHLPDKKIEDMTDEEFGQHQSEALDKASKGEEY